MKYYKVLLFLIITQNTFAQKNTIQLKIVEKIAGNFNPIIGANIFQINSDNGTITNDNGIAFYETNRKKDTLIISYVGYKNDTIYINSEKYFYITLQPDITLNEVVVTGKQLSNFVSTLDAHKTEKIGQGELKKAACCNLSEAFTTNSSIDIKYSDAVTGAKEIKLLGLSGLYVQSLLENQPILRGLTFNFGLDNIPAPWLKTISISKGIPATRSGYEGIAGSMNVELKDCFNEKQKLFLDVFGSSDARLETNLIINHKINNNVGTTLFFNGAFRPVKIDNNNDGFLDQPLLKQYNFANKWSFNKGKLEGQYTVKLVSENRTGGQTNFNALTDKNSNTIYGININTKRAEVFAKTGILLNEEMSIGTQFSGFYHQQQSYFGTRNYNATQGSFNANILFQANIKNDDNTLVIGTSFVYDKIDEQLDSSALKNEYFVPGFFADYTYKWTDKITIVSGVRLDYHNKAKLQVNPRLQARFLVAEKTTLRLSVGRGFRVPFTLSENQNLLASSRNLVFNNLPNNEIAWNYGISINQKFNLANREGSLNIDFFRTDFVQQQVVDITNADGLATISALNGKSNSNSALVEVNYEIIKGLDFKTAYKFELTKTTYHNIFMQKPLTNQHKGLVTLTYKTNNKNWQFDVNTSIHGKHILPNSFAGNIGKRYTKKYALLNAQIMKTFKKAELFIGGENLTNFKQQNPIIGSNLPFNKPFDTNQVWAPIMGTTIYGGCRIFI